MLTIRTTAALLLQLTLWQQACAQTPAEFVRESLLCTDSGIHPRPLSDSSGGIETGLDPQNITLLNWNVQKASHPGLTAELESLSTGADLVLLQEAVLTSESVPTPLASRFAAFAKGYSNQGQVSGVMTLSAKQASDHCALRHIEPWLGSPKATSITWFDLQGFPDSLLVINLHAVNFTVGSDDFLAQLEASAELIAQHRGPVVFAGDFNTWNEGRKSALLQTRDALGLDAVTFDDDQRIRVLGYALDHILVRGMSVVESHTLAVNSSDHNPLMVTLAVKPQQRTAPE